ncbi:MAG: flagellar filament capping protein FliD, partial [Pseudomonadota bacterium]|nr:flagellar filament capping protein FliD [Pseudomonadota bacterium]
SIQTWIRATLSASVGGIPGGAGSITSLSQIGVAFQKDGSLALDSVKLQTALDNNFDSMAGLFAVRGKPTDSLIAYTGATDWTAAGNYAITVTQLASQGSLTGNQAAGLAIIAGVNDQLDIRVDGVTASVTLAAGTYASADTLVAEVQSKLNGAASLTDVGNSVVVSQSAGVLSIISARYGSTSSIAITGGNGATSLMGASPTSTAGADVTGTINGATAVGTGNVLTAPAGGASEGLRLTINGGTLGARGTVGFSRGYADRLDKLVGDLLTNDGIIASRTDGLAASMKDIDRRQEDMNRRLESTEARYRAQFTALDTMLSSLNQTSQFFEQQLASLQKND